MITGGADQLHPSTRTHSRAACLTCLRARPPCLIRADPLRPGRVARIRPPYEFLDEEGMQQSVGIFGSPEEQQLHWENCRRASFRTTRRWECRSHRCPIRAWRPRQARDERVRLRISGRSQPRPAPTSEKRDGATGYRQDHQARVELQRHRDTPYRVCALPHEHHLRRPRATSATGCCIQI